MSCKTFEVIIVRIDTFADELVFDKKIDKHKKFKLIAEWLSIAAAKYAARDNEVLLTKLHKNIQSIIPKNSGRYSSLRVDTLAAAVFIEVLYPVKYTILLAEQGLYTLISSNTILF